MIGNIYRLNFFADLSGWTLEKAQTALNVYNAQGGILLPFGPLPIPWSA
jgi:hypothetical protein